jgi:ubiquinone/menaquinone biosynthesis C-methylase UbiE
VKPIDELAGVRYTERYERRPLMSDDASDVDKQAYKERMVGAFSRGAGLYGQFGPSIFTHFGKKVVECAHLEKGTAVLDIACGRGACLFPASEQVGKTGRVVGIDLASGMVAELHKQIDALNLSQVEIQQMDAENLQFPAASFDNVLCGFALFFFPNQGQALSEILRVLKPDGAFTTSTFGESDERWDWQGDLMQKYSKKADSRPSISIKHLGTREEIEETMAEAGFKQVEIVVEEKEFFYADEDEYWDTLWSHGFRYQLERMDESTLDAFRQDLYSHLIPMKQERGIPWKIQALITKANCGTLNKKSYQLTA